MSDTSITPSIEVTIGRQTRLYHAFITTAPAVLDAPSTVTLYAGPLKDIAGLAADDLVLRLLGTLRDARALALIVSGARKGAVLRRTLDGPVGPDLPATLLRAHPAASVIADRDALG